MNQREIGPDIIRMLAIISVVCGHFFTVNTPFNQAEFVGGGMFVQGCLRAFFANLGVPLFLMLSGYFNCRKDFSLGYYKKIRRILVPYFVISILTWGVLSVDYSITRLIFGTLGYNIIGYAWYVEMFIGLYLSIPFINIVLEKIYTSGNRMMVVVFFVVLIFMTSLPPLVDRGDFRIVPNYWQMCFPVLLYATGAYIRYFQIEIKHRALAVVSICAIYLQYPIINFLKVNVVGGGSVPNLFGPYYAIPGYVAMTLIFLLLYKIDVKCSIVRRVVGNISMRSYEMFLFSYLCDRFVYPWVMERYYTNQNAFVILFIPITITVLLTSYILASLYHVIDKWVVKVKK